MKLLIDFILVSGMIFNVIILILLWRRGIKRLPEWLLIVIFSCMLLETVHFYGGLHDLDVLTFFTFPFEDAIVFFLGPALLLYVKSLYQPAPGLVRGHLKHFIPLLLYLVFITVPIMVSIIQEGFVFEYLRYLVNSDYVFLAHMFFLLAYTLLSLRRLNRFEDAIKDYFSDLGQAGFIWIRRFFYGILVVIAVDISTSAYELTFGVLDWDTGYLTVAAMIFLIAYLGYHGVSQSRVLLPDFLAARTQVQGKLTDSVSTPTPPLPEADPLAQRLEKVLIIDEAYLDEDLTLGKLAELLPTTDKKLSLLLNQHLTTSFYDLINQHRVEAVKRMMADDSFGRRPNIEIAYACGFKSKSSFNRVFKKQTGLTPGAYRETSSKPV